MKLERKTLGTLLNTFYVPTFVFAIVSMISFLIHPSIVPGRMGMIVMLLLISSNVYTTVEAPASRGFSSIEVWITGSQIPILFALLEYGFILLFTKYFKEIDFKAIDLLSLQFILIYYLVFNLIYWFY